jgi:hypothetical protein
MLQNKTAPAISSPTTMALAHWPGIADIVSHVTPAWQATDGDDERDKELKPAERKDGRGREETREGRSRCSSSMSGHSVWVAACSRRHNTMPITVGAALQSGPALGTRPPSTVAAERMSQSHRPATCCSVSSCTGDHAFERMIVSQL